MQALHFDLYIALLWQKLSFKKFSGPNSLKQQNCLIANLLFSSFKLGIFVLVKTSNRGDIGGRCFINNSHNSLKHYFTVGGLFFVP